MLDLKENRYAHVIHFTLNCHVRARSRGRVQGVPPPTPPEMTCGFLIQLVRICQKKKKTMWFIAIEVEQGTSAPPPKKNPGSAPACILLHCNTSCSIVDSSSRPLSGTLHTKCMNNGTIWHCCFSAAI